MLSFRTLVQIQTYIIAISVFFIIIIFLPILSNIFFLPKLTLLQFGALALCITEIIKIFLIKKNNHFHYFDILMLIFLICNVLANLHSNASIISFFGFYRNEGMNLLYLPAFIVFAKVFHQLPKKNKDFIGLFIVSGTLLSSIYTIFHYIGYKINFGIIERPNGLDGHPIWSSGSIGFGLIYSIFFHINVFKNNTFKIIVKILFIGIHCVALYLLFSTTAWVSLFLTIAIYYLFFILKIHKKITIKKILIIFICFGILAFIFFKLAQYKNYSVSRRISEIKTTAQLFKHEFFPITKKWGNVLFGLGQNNTGFYFIKYKDIKNINDKEWLLNPTQLHNHFLELLFTIGFPGLSIWLLLTILTLYDALKQKDPLIFSLVIYLFFWQLLYILLPTGLLFTFLAFSMQKIRSLDLSSFLKKISDFFIIILFILFLIFIYINSRLILADYMFNQELYTKAINLNPYNEDYIRQYTTLLHNDLIRCQPSRVDDNIEGCIRENMKLSAMEEYNLLKQAISINPLNPNNWNGYSASTFALSFLDPNNKTKYRSIALYAGKKAYELNPTEAYYADGLGLTYLDIQDYQNAEKYFLIARTLQPHSIMFIDHLMEVYKQTGDKIKQQQLELLKKE